MNKKTALFTYSFFILLLAGIVVTGCKKTAYKLTTTNDVNIVGYLDKYPDSFSLFRQILDRTGNTAFLNAYGNYTCFAPTNSGVKRWFTSISATTVESADINILKEMVKFHLLPDTVSTGSFTDGKMPVPTMLGQFLISGVTFSGATSSYTVNRQAAVIKSNVRVGNGILHEIDHVLVPAKLTLAKQIEADPKYSIFLQAVQETGFYVTLNTIDPDTTKKWMTVLAETNQALADSGFATYASLKAKYSQTGNPTLPNDSLHMYVAYHILPGIKFLGDIITQSAHQTMEPQEVVSTQLINQQVIVNEDIFDGVLEKGILLVRNMSDNAATNGVLHSAAAHFSVKYRKPAAVFWDLSAFTEIKNLPAYYRRQNYTFTRQNELDKPIKDIDWEYKGASNFLTYEYTTTGSIANFAHFNDIITLPLGPPNRATWWDFKTPVIIKGRYKVWVCYRSRNAVTCNVRVNGELMQRPVNLGAFRPAGTDAELESIGWKRYTESLSSGNFAGRMVGIVDILTTERHMFRLEPIVGTNAANHLDMVHFIPVNDNQVLPRFRPDGTKVYF